MIFLLLFLLGLLAIVWAVRQSYVMEGEVTPHIPPRLGWSIALAVLGFQFFAYDMDPGIGWGLFGICVLVGAFLTLEQQQRTRLAWSALVVGTLAGLFLGWRANGFVMAVNAAVILACIGTLFLVRSVDAVRWHALWKIRTALFYAARSLRQIPAMFRLGKTAGGDKRRSTLVTMVNTTVITVLLLGVFVILLANADAVFERIVQDILDQAFARVLISVLIAFGLTVALTIRFKPELLQNVPSVNRWFGYVETLVPTVALSLLFAAFLVIQARYLYADEVAFQALNITYADYVRRGMIELLIAVAIGGAIVYGLILRQREEEHAPRAMTLRSVAAVLTVELMLLLLSAYQRNALYMDAYGLTRVRLVGEIFLFWLAGILVLLLALALIKRIEERLVLQGAMALSAIVFLVLNTWNIDRTIALTNPPVRQDTDLYYIAILSGDASEGWVNAINEARSIYMGYRNGSELSVADQSRLMKAKMAMRTLLNRMELPGEYDWQEYNAGTQAGEAILRENQYRIMCIANEIADYQLVHNLDWYDQEWAEVYGNKSTFAERGRYQPENMEILRAARPAPYAADTCD